MKAKNGNVAEINKGNANNNYGVTWALVNGKNTIRLQMSVSHFTASTFPPPTALLRPRDTHHILVLYREAHWVIAHVNGGLPHGVVAVARHGHAAAELETAPPR